MLGGHLGDHFGDHLGAFSSPGPTVTPLPKGIRLISHETTVTITTQQVSVNIVEIDDRA